MLSLFINGLARYTQIFVVAISGFFSRDRHFFGAALALVLLPLVIIMQAIHWLLWLMDEVIYPDYRNVRVDKPIFIIGPPRTGTTFLHHVLAGDQRYSTFKLWECLFGITISGRKICAGLARIDRAVGSPISRLASMLSRKLLSDMDAVHPISLNAPEEDFFVFMPVATCFLLIVPFPGANWLFEFSRFDIALDDKKKKRYIDWYYRCIQKHLFIHGREKQFLSKNASFGGMTGSLLDRFPDARVLTTWRDPVEAVPSQLSSLAPSLAWFGFKEMPNGLRDRLVDQMIFYYKHLATLEQQHPARVTQIQNTAMRSALSDTVIHAFSKVGLSVSDDLADHLQQQSTISRQHTSGHKYCAEDFGLSDELIRSRFADKPG